MKIASPPTHPFVPRAARRAPHLVALALAASACVTEPADDGDAPLTLEERIEVLADCTPTDVQVFVLDGTGRIVNVEGTTFVSDPPGRP